MILRCPPASVRPFPAHLQRHVEIRGNDSIFETRARKCGVRRNMASEGDACRHADRLQLTASKADVRVYMAGQPREHVQACSYLHASGCRVRIEGYVFRAIRRIYKLGGSQRHFSLVKVSLPAQP